MKTPTNTDQDLTAILSTFAPGMALFVPDELIALWFPPGPTNGVLPASVAQDISKLAAKLSCSAEYVPNKKAVQFTKCGRC